MLCWYVVCRESRVGGSIESFAQTNNISHEFKSIRIVCPYNSLYLVQTYWKCAICYRGKTNTKPVRRNSALLYENTFLHHTRYSQTFGHNFQPSQMAEYFAQGTVKVCPSPSSYESRYPISNDTHVHVTENVTDTSPNVHRIKRRNRTSFNSKQILKLEHEFARGQFIRRSRKEELAIELNLPVDQIKIWFQNRRMREKNFSRNGWEERAKAAFTAKSINKTGEKENGTNKVGNKENGEDKVDDKENRTEKAGNKENGTDKDDNKENGAGKSGDKEHGAIADRLLNYVPEKKNHLDTSQINKEQLNLFSSYFADDNHEHLVAAANALLYSLKTFPIYGNHWSYYESIASYYASLLSSSPMPNSVPGMISSYNTSRYLK